MSSFRFTRSRKSCRHLDWRTCSTRTLMRLRMMRLPTCPGGNVQQHTTTHSHMSCCTLPQLRTHASMQPTHSGGEGVRWASLGEFYVCTVQPPDHTGCLDDHIPHNPLQRHNIYIPQRLRPAPVPSAQHSTGVVGHQVRARGAPQRPTSTQTTWQRLLRAACAATRQLARVPTVHSHTASPTGNT